ncbi:MAG: phosphoribosylamine--glycine ligase [Planctomycetes bacterium]|nr:phosphoribosylamine--glycine ligase [Planctomycetota bacterium]
MKKTSAHPLPCPAKCNVFIAGSGGREHALAWKLKQSPRLGKLWVDPKANAGLRQLGEVCPQSLDPKNKFHFRRFLEKESIHLVVVGPEALLAAGFADEYHDPPNRLVFGPTKAASKLEWDKAWCKQVLRSAGVVMAEGKSFTQLDAALNYIRSREDPVVVKATGLCAGKGVTVCNNKDEAIAAATAALESKVHGEAGATIVIEERLHGQEISVLALVDGKTIWMLDACQDHKQVGEGDLGPNTGGMGAYSPTPLATDAVLRTLERDVFVPTLDALRREEIEFRGVLFAGIILTHAGPKVLEFNCRFGDPETQSLMARWRGDLLEALWLTSSGQLDQADISFERGSSCCVVVCAEGYPGKPRTGDPIAGIDEAEQMGSADQKVVCFHASTAPGNSGMPMTSGGRVIGVTAVAADLVQASRLATQAAARIRFEGAFFRRDIGGRVLEPSSRPVGKPVP